MQQETVQVLLDPPLPSAFPLLHFREGEEGLAARLSETWSSFRATARDPGVVTE